MFETIAVQVDIELQEDPMPILLWCFPFIIFSATYDLVFSSRPGSHVSADSRVSQ
jgi:hypothetical protein